MSAEPLTAEKMEIAATPLGERFATGTESDIGEVTYRDADLRIEVDTVSASGHETRLVLTFEAPRGFRMLDEGDLIRYWDSKKFEPGYHLFEITAGGWKAQEMAVPGMLSVSDAIAVKEWFVATTNQCMNVLAADAPKASRSAG